MKIYSQFFNSTCNPHHPTMFNIQKAKQRLRNLFISLRHKLTSICDSHTSYITVQRRQLFPFVECLRYRSLPLNLPAQHHRSAVDPESSTGPFSSIKTTTKNTTKKETSTMSINCSNECRNPTDSAPNAARTTLKNLKHCQLVSALCNVQITTSSLQLAIPSNIHICFSVSKSAYIL